MKDPHLSILDQPSVHGSHTPPCLPIEALSLALQTCPRAALFFFYISSGAAGDKLWLSIYDVTVAWLA